MCCYDGVYVSDETAGILSELVREEAAFFRDVGLVLPEQVVVDGEWRGVVAGKKTAVRAHDYSRTVPEFPAHFNNTACVFWMQDGRCSLQVLSTARALHPWFYKPIDCWLHPIAVEHENGGCITLYDDRTDPFKFPGYPGYATQTRCGAVVDQGNPAHVVLADELAFLGGIVGLALKRLSEADMGVEDD